MLNQIRVFWVARPEVLRRCGLYHHRVSTPVELEFAHDADVIIIDHPNGEIKIGIDSSRLSILVAAIPKGDKKSSETKTWTCTDDKLDETLETAINHLNG